MEFEKVSPPNPEQEKSKELIPIVEGLVFHESGSFLKEEDFLTSSDMGLVPNDLARPVILETAVPPERKKGNKNAPMEAKSVLSSGKGCFVEHPINVSGVNFNFVQWKGVGGSSKVVKESLPKLSTKITEIPNPLSSETDFPLSHVDSGDLSLDLITGGEYVLNMKDAQEKSNLARQKGIRTPLTMAWFKFSRSFAEKQGLPLPNNDDPHDTEGEDSEEWEKRLREAGLNTDFKISKKGSNILGQEIRVFRNVFRLLDLSETLKNTNETEKHSQVSAIIKSSRVILEKEFDRKMTNEEFVYLYTELLAKQATLLVRERIIFHSIAQFNQNITLAAEIVDWNYVSFVESESQSEDNLKIYKQLFTFCGYLKSISEAITLIDNTEINDSKVVDSFLEKIQEELPDSNCQEFKKILSEDKDFSDLLQFTVPGTPWEQDFKKYQEYADLFAERILADKAS